MKKPTGKLTVIKGGKIESKQSLTKPVEKVVVPPQKTHSHTRGRGRYTALVKTRQQLFSESLYLKLNTAPFNQNSIYNLKTVVDHREPPSIAGLMSRTKIGHNVSVGTLELGDICIRNQQNGNELIIERKTVTDFTASIISNRAHDQAERLYDYQMKAASEGRDVKVVWIIESENQGDRGLYSSLELIQQVDGMVAYMTGILGQFVVESMSQNHLVYLVAKLAQTHHEKALAYKVTVGSANRGRKRRNEEMEALGLSSGGRGVRRAANGLEDLLIVMGVRANVAKSMAQTGLNLAQLTQLNKEQLLEFKGVGIKLADEIYSIFNRQ